MHPAPPARPPAATVHWTDFIARLYDDAEAELDQTEASPLRG
jgi:hypothetical protein